MFHAQQRKFRSAAAHRPVDDTVVPLFSPAESFLATMRSMICSGRCATSAAWLPRRWTGSSVR
jgi:hypothetical protein